MAALSDPATEIRVGAIDALAKIGPEAAEAIPVLTAAIADSHDSVCVSAVLALSVFKSSATGAVPGLARALAACRPRTMSPMSFPGVC
jgi:hypothetical protein